MSKTLHMWNAQHIQADFFLITVWTRRDKRPKESEGPQPWMHNRAGRPWGVSTQGPCEAPPDPPLGMESWSPQVLRGCQLRGRSCQPSLGIISVEDYCLAQGHAPSRGSPYPMIDRMQKRKARLPHPPAETMDPPLLAGSAVQLPPQATPAPFLSPPPLPSPGVDPQGTPCNLLLSDLHLSVHCSTVA